MADKAKGTNLIFCWKRKCFRLLRLGCELKFVSSRRNIL